MPKIVGNIVGAPIAQKTVYEFSNGIQLVQGVTEEWEGYDGVFVRARVNGEVCEKQLILRDDDTGKVLLLSDESGWSAFAYCDEAGNPIHEHYATKEELGDAETALDIIIAEQEAIIAIQNSLIGGDNS